MHIGVELNLFANDFPIEDAFSEIGIDTGRMCVREEKTFRTICGGYFTRERECCITYKTDDIDTIDVRDVLDNMCELLKGKTNIIKSVIEKYQLKSQICVILNITDDPIFIFTKEFIQLAAFLNCSIAIDYYYYTDIEKTIECNDCDMQDL